jgi:hypothetical protein
METKPVCVGDPEKGFEAHEPTPMYKAGKTPPPDRQTRFRCPKCGRTVSGRNAELLLTTVSEEEPTQVTKKRLKRRRASGGFYSF